MSSKKAVVAIASGLALTGAGGVADAAWTPDETDLFTIDAGVDVDLLVLDGADDALFLPPLPEADDEVAFEERYAQTWGGGSGNDGLISGPRAPGGRISPTGPKLDNVSRPASVPTPRQQVKEPRRQKQPRNQQRQRKKRN